MNENDFMGRGFPENVVKVDNQKSDEIKLMGFFKKIICEFCGLALLTDEKYEEHKLLHHVCTICKKTFVVKKNLVRHVDRVHTGNGEYYTCRICNKLVKYSDNLLLHLKRVHTVHTGESIFECDTCDKSFKTHNSLYVHRRQVHIFGKAVKCKVCDKQFSNIPYMKSHLRNTHSGIKSICPICGDSIKALNIHIKVKHTEHANVICDICGKEYSSERNLSIHKRTKHSDKQKNHVCEICGASFQLRVLLKNHYVVHSDERNFKCDFCDKTFKLNSVLHTHMRVHNDFEPYKCKCGQSFRWKSTYENHVCSFISVNNER